jgi:hypothetical protein
MTDPFFGVIFLAGRIHVRGIPVWGPWNRAKMQFSDESAVDPKRPTIRTHSELLAALKESSTKGTTTTAWIHRRLEAVVHRLWTKQTAHLWKGFARKSMQP